MLAATLTTVVVFFPVTFLYGVSKFLFSALALAVVISLFASYAVAMTVVPLFCARFIKHAGEHSTPSAETDVDYHSASTGKLRRALQVWFNGHFERFLTRYDRRWWRSCSSALHPRWSSLAPCLSRASRCYPLLGLSFFPRTDAGQFVINLKAPSGTRIDAHGSRSEASRRHDPQYSHAVRISA